jgi:hypothetical protein
VSDWFWTDNDPTDDSPRRRTVLPQRLETDADAVERDLLKLVLTIIELIRQLMEKQALRRVDEGDLTEEQPAARPPIAAPPRAR